MLITQFVFRHSHKKKSHGVISGLRGGHKNAAYHTIRRSPNFCFKHWMTEMVGCGVASSCWNEVHFRTTRLPLQFPPQKSFLYFVISHRININNASIFVFKNKKGPMMYYKMAHHSVTLDHKIQKSEYRAHSTVYDALTAGCDKEIWIMG